MQVLHWRYCEAEWTFKIEQVRQEGTMLQLASQVELVVTRIDRMLQTEQLVAEEQLSQ